MNEPGARTYTLQELAERCGVTPRTIRFYTEEGLLPPPLQEGRLGLYTDEHVERLELIRQLKAAFLPLREIHRLVNSLSSVEIRTLLESLPRASRETASPAEAGDQTAGQSALDYIRSLQRGVNREEKPLDSPPPYDEAHTVLLRKARQEQLAPDDEEFARWQRITIVPGLEIHIRESNDYHFVSRVRQILEFARRLFRSE
ncbi:MerR family transcriptional regulator [uncultured Thermanaerothrix sp.]|uniref:MerR family transcriptional regulator n=1 Tax=uncultured Thermanaerothrix sp. TaxID=1195149 RepID=UPI002625DFC4|nr:MerR family transcriptional regulator [uncultured Thermanaerothrix sp.]